MKRFLAKRERKVVPLADTLPWKLYAFQRAKQGVQPLRDYSDSINSKIYLWLGDITQLSVDSIVNAANSSLMGGGGVDGAIHAAAGPDLRTECAKLNGCRSGDAKITSGCRLPAKHIIHTVGPRGRNPPVLKECYSRCFELMEEHKLKSIAFPCVSTGVYGYPSKDAAEVAIETTRSFLESNHTEVEGVVFCLFTNKDIEAYNELLPAYFPYREEDKEAPAEANAITTEEDAHAVVEEDAMVEEKDGTIVDGAHKVLKEDAMSVEKGAHASAEEDSMVAEKDALTVAEKGAHAATEESTVVSEKDAHTVPEDESNEESTQPAKRKCEE